MRGSPIRQLICVLLGAAALGVPVWMLTSPDEPAPASVSAPMAQAAASTREVNWTLTSSADCRARIMADGNLLWEGSLTTGDSRRSTWELPEAGSDWILDASGTAGVLAVRLQVQDDGETIADQSFWGEGRAGGVVPIGGQK